ncbi:MAG: site-specific integrase [Lentisphaerae bacterium]|nr:site-specific integrase [Lentisphaerota bacterium]
MDNTPNWDLPPERFLTQEEIGRLLLRANEIMALGKARKRKPLVRDAIIIFTALYSGLRRAEICDLMVRDITIGGGRSHLVVRRGKGNKARTVHIGKAFKSIVRDYLIWKAENGELHPESFLIRNSKSERYTPTALWKRWRKYAPNGHRLHDARHTTAAQLLRAGQSLRMIAQQLGHSRLSTTAIYAQVAPDLMHEGMNRMEALAKDAVKAAARSPVAATV